MNTLGFNTLTVTNSNQSEGTRKVLARVVKVILGPTNPDGSADEDFEKYGKWDSIGAIRFTLIYDNQTDRDANVSTNIAKPLHSGFRLLPVKGEIVEIVTGPSTRLNDNSLAVEYYYDQPYNLWNTVHYNGFPNLQDYTEQVTKGEYSVSDNFTERSDIQTVECKEGDAVIQGRWGSSIRFGSTINDSNESDPITVLGLRVKKGQDPWLLTKDGLPFDDVGIIMSSTQLIEIPNLDKYPFSTYNKNQNKEVIIVK